MAKPIRSRGDRPDVILYAGFTLVLATAALLCGAHAWQSRDRESIALWGTAVVYGLVLEKLVVLHFERYTYPAAKMPDLFGIPLAIGFGWSVVLYSGYVTADHFDLEARYVPAFAGLYALHLDLAGDAVAIRVPFWEWTPPGIWFGVPLGNFFGWFVVASLFTGFFLVLRDRVGNPLVRGGLTMVLAVSALVVVLEGYAMIAGGIVWREAVVVGGVIALSAAWLSRAEFDYRSSSPLLTLAVLLFHGYYLVVLFVLGLHLTMPALLLLAVAMLAVGAVLHVGPVPGFQKPWDSLRSS